jgi:hypothetical protein
MWQTTIWLNNRDHHPLHQEITHRTADQARTGVTLARSIADRSVCEESRTGHSVRYIFSSRHQDFIQAKSAF